MDAAKSEDGKPTWWSLPRELRDLIYEYSCEGVQVSIKGEGLTRRDTQNRSSLVTLQTVGPSNTGMLRVCKQMRIEALPIYFLHTYFMFSGPFTCAAWLKRHVAPTGLMSKLKHLRIEHESPATERSWLKQKQKEYRQLGKRMSASNVRVIAIIILELLSRDLDSKEAAELSWDAVETLVIDVDMETSWTSDPAGFDLSKKGDQDDWCTGRPDEELIQGYVELLD